MPNIPNYACTSCKQPKQRDELTVKKVLFTSMGAGSSSKRSRVTDWLCDICLDRDRDWNREPNVSPVREVANAS